MMSNGPRSARRSLHIGARVDLDARDLRPRTQDERRAGSPRAAGAAASAELRALAADDVLAEVAVGPGARCAHGTRSAGRSSTIATANRSCSRAIAHQRRARLALDVGGVDDRQPPARAAAAQAISCSTANASSVALWSFGSSATSPRQKSDEMHLGRPGSARPRTCSCRSPRRRSARPGTGSGSSIFIARTPPSASAGPPRRPRARPAGTAPCSRKRAATRAAHAANSARVHSKRWSGWRCSPAGSVSHSRLYSAFGVVTTTQAGCAEPNTLSSTRLQPRRIEVLDHLDQRRRVVAGRRLSR